MKIKGRPTWLFWIITVILLSVIGKYDFLYTQFWPWDIIKWLVIPFLFITLITVTIKKYQEIDDLKQQIIDKENDINAKAICSANKLGKKKKYGLV